MTHLLAIDPGMATGIVFGEYTETTPFEVFEKWQVERGIFGWLNWTEEHIGGTGGIWWGPQRHGNVTFEYEVVCEKFVPWASGRSFKLEELEPLRIEGSVQTLLGSPHWQRSTAMVLAEGDTRGQRKSASDDVLRRLGLWSTPTSMGPDYTLKDTNDINSAMKHAVAYLKSIEHEPTLQAIEGES
jgi:hypothetical protein